MGQCENVACTVEDDLSIKYYPMESQTLPTGSHMAIGLDALRRAIQNLLSSKCLESADES